MGVCIPLCTDMFGLHLHPLSHLGFERTSPFSRLHRPVCAPAYRGITRLTDGVNRYAQPLEFRLTETQIIVPVYVYTCNSLFAITALHGMLVYFRDVIYCDRILFCCWMLFFQGTLTLQSDLWSIHAKPHEGTLEIPNGHSHSTVFRLYDSRTSHIIRTVYARTANQIPSHSGNLY